MRCNAMCGQSVAKAVTQPSSRGRMQPNNPQLPAVTTAQVELIQADS